MKREAELQRRLHALQSLGEAVRAMKSLSAHHFRETRSAVEPARAYRTGVERMLGWSDAALPAGVGPAGLLVIGGELGLCGGFNSRVVGTAARVRSTLGDGPTLCVGHRASVLLRRRAVRIERVYAGPTSVRGITNLLLQLAEDLLSTYATRQLSSFDIVSSRFDGIGNTHAVNTRLLPLERPSDAVRTARYVSRAHFASAAIREFLYITVYDVLLDSMTAEHGARIVATQAADRWIDEQIGRLRRSLQNARREASTQEMIEIGVGARARARHSG